jgi:hypothetical protein
MSTEDKRDLPHRLQNNTRLFVKIYRGHGCTDDEIRKELWKAFGLGLKPDPPFLGPMVLPNGRLTGDSTLDGLFWMSINERGVDRSNEMQRENWAAIVRRTMEAELGTPGYEEGDPFVM